MKKFIILCLFCSTSIFANSNFTNKNSLNNKLEQFKEASAPNTCNIIYKDTLKYCRDHGFSESQSVAIAEAARAECNKLVKSIQ